MMSTCQCIMGYSRNRVRSFIAHTPGKQDVTCVDVKSGGSNKLVYAKPRPKIRGPALEGLSAAKYSIDHAKRDVRHNLWISMYVQ